MSVSLSSIKKTLFSEHLETPAFLNVKYIPSLDGLRAFAILFVIIAHINFAIQNTYISSVFMGGVLGVRIFFVISGFLITTLLLREKISNKGISLKKFYIRRFLRILPVYLLAILVIFILDQIFSLHIATRLYVHVLTFTENFNEGDHWYTRHFWSLSVEEQFYLLFPFILKKSLKFYIKLSLLLICISPVVSFFFYHHQYVHSHWAVTMVDTAYLVLAPGLISILIGSLTAIVLFKFKMNTHLHIRFLSVFQALVILMFWYFDKNGSFISGIIRDLLITAFLISTICFSNSVFYKLLNTSILKKIGILSYSIYIWQQLFVNRQPWAHSFKYANSLWLNLPVLLIVSYLSYHYFEKPFLKFKTKFSSIKPKPVVEM
jgi:peptidoglycan/LPS O-acetylase OafA/YrhL